LASRSEYDIAVIGAGPGGYVAAIRAGQLGLKTVVIERDEVGGICLNWGCIPSKALLRNAEVVSLAKHGEEYGITFDNLKVDYSKAYERSRTVVSRLTKGVASLLKKNKVDVIKGSARFVDAHTLTISPSEDVVVAKNIIIATGGRARSIPPLPIDGEVVVTSRHAIEQKTAPSSVVIVGGGAIGVEFASIYHAYGAKVTVVELLPRLVPNEDEEISQQLERSFKKQGIEIMTGAKVTGVTKKGKTAQVKVEKDGVTSDISADRVLVAIGIQGNIEDMGLEKAGVATERGYVKVDDNLATNVKGVYAIGDVTGKLLLAHVASAQGVMVVERIAGLESPGLDYTDMPKATYCTPQVASFGLTEKQAREQGHDVKIGKFPFIASGKALALGHTDGFAKLVTEAKHGEILGVHLIGPEVTELLAEMSMTRMLEGTTTELGWVVHSHPTLSEALKEAALAAKGEAINI
jgi:dihydrolipoamide dehydrogenase